MSLPVISRLLRTHPDREPNRIPIVISDVQSKKAVVTAGSRSSVMRAAIPLLVVSMLALAACGSGGSMDATSAPEAGSVADGRDVVVMRLIAYVPATLEVSAGSTVTWKQQDAGFHTVTSGSVSKDPSGSVKTSPDGTFDSGQLAKDKEFTRSFDETGTFTYFCKIHPATMSGQVSVR